MPTLRDVEVKYDRDADGRIVRAGASWSETSPFAEQMLISTAVISGFAMAGGFLWAMAAEQMNPFLGFGFFGFIGSIALLRFMPQPERALYFLHDGRMVTPCGVFYHPVI